MQSRMCMCSWSRACVAARPWPQATSMVPSTLSGTFWTALSSNRQAQKHARKHACTSIGMAYFTTVVAQTPRCVGAYSCVLQVRARTKAINL